MDESSYWSRVQRIFNMMDIRTAFVTSAQVDAALDLLEQHEQGGEISAEKLDRARKIKEAVIHPDTGEKIFLPLRLSFIIPCNLVLDTLMLSARGFSQNVGAQWLNQTYNCLHYYANRNASNAESMEKIFQAYLGATASSVGAAVGLNALLDRAPQGRPWTRLARKLIPFCAVAAADVLNLGITRRDEFLQGIKVYDEKGEEVGESRRAGAMAVSACILARVSAAAPVLLLPPLVMHRLERTRFFLRHSYLKTPALMGMIALSIQAGVPLSFGIFKQKASVDVASLEPSLWNCRVSEVYYNKGL
ncbi:sideroflexin-5 [Selaginella moellendorffii]|nr:sideroflexin-5 [Selaginella moellendorffii]|eukprot:XP_002960929.2 sideroflexin-5 [Selaginella moellendorffii]